MKPRRRSKPWIVLQANTRPRRARALHRASTERLGLNAARLAEAPGVSRSRIAGILHGRRGVTADTALRLERAFGVSAVFRLNLRSHYELETREPESGSGD